MKIAISFSYDPKAIEIRRSAAPNAEFVKNGSYWLMERAEFEVFCDAIAAAAAVADDIKAEVAYSRMIAERVGYRLLDLVERFHEKLGPRFKAAGVRPVPMDGHTLCHLVLIELHGTMNKIPGMAEAREGLAKTARYCGLEADALALCDDIAALAEERKAILITMPVMGHATDDDAVEAAEMIADIGFQVLNHRVDRRGNVRVIVAGKDTRAVCRAMQSRTSDPFSVSITAI